DFHVTGVQTCALPIWTAHRRSTIGPRAAGPMVDRRCAVPSHEPMRRIEILVCAAALAFTPGTLEAQAPRGAPGAPDGFWASAGRSAERRGGTRGGGRG